jgi:hypothetical protein
MLPHLKRQAYNHRMSRFTVITGTPPPDTREQRVIDRIKKTRKPANMIQCPRCGSREVLPLTTGALLRDGKVTGGTTVHVCASCFMKGERVVLA